MCINNVEWRRRTRRKLNKSTGYTWYNVLYENEMYSDTYVDTEKRNQWLTSQNLPILPVVHKEQVDVSKSTHYRDYGRNNIRRWRRKIKHSMS